MTLPRRLGSRSARFSITLLRLQTESCPSLPPCTCKQTNPILTCRRQVARRAEAKVQDVQNALVPAETQRDLQVRAQKVSSALQKFTSERQVYIEKSIGTLQKVCPCPSLSADNSSSQSQSTSLRALSPLSSCLFSETSYSSMTIPSSSLRSVVPRAISTRYSTPSSAGLQGRH
jgi:hypothetical protein